MYGIQVCGAPPSSARTTRFVIVNNGSYRAPDEFAPHFGVTAPRAPRCRSWTFVRSREGVEAELVKRPAGLDSALDAAFAAEGPRLIEVRVEASPGARPKPGANPDPSQRFRSFHRPFIE